MREWQENSCTAVRTLCAVILCFTALSGCAVTPGDQVLSSPGTACSTQGGQSWPKDNPLYKNIVVADDHGRPAYLEEDFSGRIKALLDEHAASGRRSLLIYIHGGLNSEKAILEDASLGKVITTMQKDGHTPLFLLWRTGAWETWWEQTSRVRGGQRFERTIWDTPVYIATDLAQGVIRAPVTYLKQMGRVFDYYQAAPSHGWKLAGEKGRYSGNRVSIDNNLIIHDYVDDEHPDALEQVGYTLTFPSRFLLSPFVDALGTTAWENMVRRARTTIHQTAEFDPVCVTEGSTVWDELRSEPRGTGAFTKLFAIIEAWQKEHPRAEKIQITLIGHSMGTIVIGDLIRLFPTLQYRDIVYMGAATSIGEFNRSVIPYLRANATARFYNLMLHPQLEAMELFGAGVVPSGSLLEWIDEMYEPPKTILDRTLGKWRNVRMARSILPRDVSDQIVLKVFGQGYGEPHAHGAFNDAGKCFWNPGYWVAPTPDKTDIWAGPQFDWEAWWGRERGVPKPITQCYHELGVDYMNKPESQRNL